MGCAVPSSGRVHSTPLLSAIHRTNRASRPQGRSVFMPFCRPHCLALLLVCRRLDGGTLFSPLRPVCKRQRPFCRCSCCFTPPLVTAGPRFLLLRTMCKRRHPFCRCPCCFAPPVTAGFRLCRFALPSDAPGFPFPCRDRCICIWPRRPFAPKSTRKGMIKCRILTRKLKENTS